jgi:glycosyltransferase involved in cell wall biosynthesis
VFGSLSGLARRQPLRFLRLALSTWLARRRYNRAVWDFEPDAILAFNPLGVAAPVLDDLVAQSRLSRVPVYAYVSDHWVYGWPTCNPLWPAVLRFRGSRRPAVRFAARAVSRLLRLSGWLPDGQPLLDGYFYCSDFIRKLSRENSVGIASHDVVHWGLANVERLPEVSEGHFAGPEPLTFLFAGQLLEHKGLRVLLQALPRCRRPHHLIVVGDDETDYAASCKRLAAKLGVSERVHFVGKKKNAEVLPFLARSGQVLVMPSTWDEPFSIVVLEGMGIGLPVVASDTGGTAEAIRDGENGFLFERGDARGLAAVLDRLENDRGLCRRVGARGRQEVLRQYTLSGMVDQIEARLAGGAAPAARRAA